MCHFGRVRKENRWIMAAFRRNTGEKACCKCVALRCYIFKINNLANRNFFAKIRFFPYKSITYDNVNVYTANIAKLMKSIVVEKMRR